MLNPVSLNRYRLWISQHNKYEPNKVEFQHDELDKYNWNYLDQHISNDPEFDEMLEVGAVSFKFSFRFVFSCLRISGRNKTLCQG